MCICKVELEDAFVAWRGDFETRAGVAARPARGAIRDRWRDRLSSLPNHSLYTYTQGVAGGGGIAGVRRVRARA